MNIPGHIVHKWKLKLEITPEDAARYLEYTKANRPSKRDWDDHDLVPLIDSIRKNGWLEDFPILITGDTLGNDKIIYDGVRRMAALVAIGETVKVPVSIVTNIEGTSQLKVGQWINMAAEGNPETRSEIHHNILMTFVFLVYCRWIETQEADKKSIAEFDDEDFIPLLPEGLLEAFFREGKVDCKAIKKQVEECLDGRPISSVEQKILTPLYHLTRDSLPCMNKISGALLSIQVEIRRLDFSDLSHREYALAILDRLGAGRGYRKGEHGEHTTPENIREFMVCLAAPKRGEHVHDPCCGSGGLLRKAHEYIRRRHGESGKAHLSGCDISLGPYASALCNVILSGADDADIRLGDSLDSDADAGTYDCIIAVPPWGSRKIEPVTINGIAGQRSESLFLLNILNRLKPGGRAVVCMPHGFSFAGGEARKIRKLLLDQYCLEFIVDLPDGAFAPLSVKTDVYLIRNLRPEKTGHDRLYFDGLPLKWFDNEKTKKRTLVQKQQNLKAIREYMAWEFWNPEKHGIQPFFLNTIRNSGYDLSKRDPWEVDYFEHTVLDNYQHSDSVKLFALGELADVQQGVPNRKGHLSEYVDVQAQINQGPDPVRISHPTLLKIGDVDPKHEVIKSTTEHLNPEAAEKFDAKKLQPNDVLYSTGGTIGKTFLMTNDHYEEYKEGLYPASGWIRIRLKPEVILVRIDYLRAIISSPDYLGYLKGRATGSTILHLSITELKTLQVPIPPVSIQESVIESVRNYKAHAREVDAIKILNEKLWGAPTKKIDLESLVGQDADTSTFISNIVKKVENLESLTLAETRNYLESIGSSIRRFFVKLEEIERDRLTEDYSIIFIKSFDLLDGFNQIRETPTVYASLANCITSFSGALTVAEKYDSDGFNDGKYCCDLLKNILKILEHAQSLLLKGPYLGIKTHDFSSEGSFDLTIENISDLPIRGARMFLPSGWDMPQIGDYLNIDYLAPGETVPHKLKVFPSKETLLKGAHEVSVSYEVTRFDAETVETETKVTVAVPQRLVEKLKTVDSKISFDENVKHPPVHKQPGQPKPDKFDFDPEQGQMFAETSVYNPSSESEAPSAKPADVGRDLDVKEETIGNNPYIAGNNTEDLELFVGRKTIIDRIQGDFNQAGGNHLAVMDGNRRIGKTWVLDHVSENPKILPDWVRVKCSLLAGSGDDDKALSGVPTHKVFQTYARSIGKKLHSLDYMPPGKSDKGKFSGYAKIVRTQLISKDDSFADFEDFIDEVMEIIAPKSLLLMLDEYNILQAGIDSGVTNAQVPDNLRSIFAKPKVGGIITGTVKLKRFQEKHWGALYAIGASNIDITSMPEEEAIAVVRKPIEVSHKQWLAEYAEGEHQGLSKIKLNYTDEAVAEIIGICNNQPFLIQSLCHDMFNIAKSTGEKVIDRKFVEKETSIIAKITSVFTEIWRDFIQSDTQRLLLAMIGKYHYDKSKERLDPLSESLIQEKFREYNVPLEESRLRPNLEDLEDLELIKYSSDFSGHYLLRVPYMGLWLEKNTTDSYRNFDDLKSKAIAEIENTLN